MTKTQLSLPGGFSLTSVREEDRDDYVRHLEDGEIAKTIPALPQPYSQETAESWIRHRLMFLERAGVEICFVIRDPAGSLVGERGCRRPYSGYDPQRRTRSLVGVRCTVATGSPARPFVRSFHMLSIRWDWIESPPTRFISMLRLYVWSTALVSSWKGGSGGILETATGVHDTLVFGLLKEQWDALAE